MSEISQEFARLIDELLVAQWFLARIQPGESVEEQMERRDKFRRRTLSVFDELLKQRDELLFTCDFLGKIFVELVLRADEDEQGPD